MLEGSVECPVDQLAGLIHGARLQSRLINYQPVVPNDTYFYRHFPELCRVARRHRDATCDSSAICPVEEILS